MQVGRQRWRRLAVRATACAVLLPPYRQDMEARPTSSLTVKCQQNQRSGSTPRNAHALIGAESESVSHSVAPSTSSSTTLVLCEIQGHGFCPPSFGAAAGRGFPSREFQQAPDVGVAFDCSFLSRSKAVSSHHLPDCSPGSYTLTRCASPGAQQAGAAFPIDTASGHRVYPGHSSCEKTVGVQLHSRKPFGLNFRAGSGALVLAGWMPTSLSVHTRC